jgi:hypothetical protein
MSMIKIAFAVKVNQKGDGQSRERDFLIGIPLSFSNTGTVWYSLYYQPCCIFLPKTKHVPYLHWFASITTYNAFRQLY